MMINLRFQAAIGLSLSAAALAWFIESLRACIDSIISFWFSDAAWLFRAINFAKKPKKIGAMLVSKLIM
jgi:hypothetical protein